MILALLIFGLGSSVKCTPAPKRPMSADSQTCVAKFRAAKAGEMLEVNRGAQGSVYWRVPVGATTFTFPEIPDAKVRVKLVAMPNPK